jgi:hypothetical protein
MAKFIKVVVSPNSHSKRYEAYINIEQITHIEVYAYRDYDWSVVYLNCMAPRTTLASKLSDKEELGELFQRQLIIEEPINVLIARIQEIIGGTNQL